MKAIAFIIGSEIFDGKTIDKNSIKLYNLTKSLGFTFDKKLILKDNESLIIESLKKEINDFDLFFIMGGLGPTFDDVTLNSISKALNIDYQVDKDQSEKILSFLKSRGTFDNELIESNLKQARFLVNPLKNNVGFALGSYFIYKHNNKEKHFFLLPGPPNEFEYILNESVNPILKKMSQSKLYQKNLYVYNISESYLNNLLKSLNLFSFSGIYAKSHLKIITLESQDMQNIIYDLKKIINLSNLLGYRIEEIKKEFVFNDEKIKKNYFETDYDIIITDSIDFINLFFDFVSTKKLKFSLAESCCGGLFSQLFTSIPSASNYFIGSVVCYSDFSKEKIIKIDKSILNEHGAVSSQTAKALSENTKSLFNSDFAIAITGFAGPKTGHENYPVGTCFLSISYDSRNKIFTNVYQTLFKGNRNSIQNLSVIFSMFIAIYQLYD